MPDRPPHPRSTPSTNVSALVARLSAAESALEHSLGPGADAVLDSLGHAHLLRQAQTALQASEQEFRSLAEAMPQIVWITRPDGWNIYFNQQWADYTGLTLEESYGHGWNTPFHPDDRQRAWDAWQHATLNDAIYSVECRLRRADGAYRWWLVRGVPLRDPSGKILKWFGTCTDIEGLKQAEIALTRSESEQRNLAKTLTMAQMVGNVGSWETDLATQEVKWSEQTHRIFETTSDTFKPTHETFLEFIHPDDREAVNTAFLASADSRTPCSIEHRIVMRDGRIKYVEERWQFFVNAENHSAQAIGTCRDITKHKHDERQVREQNEILSKSHEGVMIVNLADKVTFWNHGAELMFGWTESEALGRPAEQLLGPDASGVVSKQRLAVERDGFWNGELQAQARNGRKLIVDCRTTLVRNEAGRPRARLSFLADITDKKLLEEKFLHAQRLESIGMLAAGIAHDLNNVLAPIMLAASLLHDNLTSPRDLKILATVEASAGRGAGLVKQILGFLRTTTGELQSTQVKYLARDIIEVIKESFPKSIQLEQDVSTNLWPVQGNATQIHQILMNLCVNARDAMPQGGTLRITAANRQLDAAEAAAIPGARPGQWLMLEVGDTGTGITSEVLARMGTPFFTTKGIGKGTGLGFSTVRGIVASHHGFLEIQTTVGRGSTFRVYLPAVESAPPRPTSTSQFASPVGQGELILVVEDDQPIREAVTDIFEQHGYRVMSCADGLEAIALFNAQPEEFSLVVTDVDMPHLGGVALARALLQIRPDLRLLAMSGQSHSATGTSDLPAMRTLAQAFLAKPFKPDELLSAVHSVLHPAEKT